MSPQKMTLSPNEKSLVNRLGLRIWS